MGWHNGSRQRTSRSECSGGLAIHAIVIRKPWFFLVGLAVTIGLMCGVIWAYVNLFEPFLALYAYAP